MKEREQNREMYWDRETDRGDVNVFVYVFKAKKEECQNVDVWVCVREITKDCKSRKNTLEKMQKRAKEDEEKIR